MTNRGITPPARPPISDSLISVVVPVFNESRVLETLCLRLRTALTKCRTTYEIILVNDGSTDGSGETIDRLAHCYPDVCGVHLSRNFGHQAAILAGLEHASGDAVVLMDSDLQDSPEAIERLLEPWQAGFDVVYAIRINRKEAVWKRFLFASFHRFLSSIAQTPIPVDAGNFGLIDARVAKAIVSFGERDRYLPGLRSWVGYKQIGVPIERGSRYDNQSRVSLAGLFRLAKTAVFSFSSLPLSMFAWIGWISFAMFLVVSGYSVYCKFFTELAVPGWTSGLVTISFFASLNALGISMLGEYVVRIYDQVRGRPMYLIDRTVNLGGSAVDSSVGELGLPRTEETSPIDLEHLDPLELDSRWDDAYQHLLSQADELLEMGSLMRSESDANAGLLNPSPRARYAETAAGNEQVGTGQEAFASDSDSADSHQGKDDVDGELDDEPLLLKMPMPPKA